MSGTGKDAALKNHGRKMSKNHGRKTQGEQLGDALNWILNPRMLADVKVHGNAKWIPLYLVQIAVLWVWSSNRALVESANEGICDAQKLFVATRIKSYQTLINALKKYTVDILPRIQIRMRQLMQKTDQARFRIGIWMIPLLALRDQVDQIDSASRTSVALALRVVQDMLRRPDPIPSRGECLRSRMSQATTDRYKKQAKRRVATIHTAKKSHEPGHQKSSLLPRNTNGSLRI